MAPWTAERIDRLEQELLGEQIDREIVEAMLRQETNNVWKVLREADEHLGEIIRGFVSLKSKEPEVICSCGSHTMKNCPWGLGIG